MFLISSGFVGWQVCHKKIKTFQCSFKTKGFLWETCCTNKNILKLHCSLCCARTSYLQSGLHLIQSNGVQCADPRLQEFYGILIQKKSTSYVQASDKTLCSCSYNWGKKTWRNWCHLCSMTQFSGGISDRQSYEYGHFIQCVPTESTRLLTIKLGPCTPALRGPCNINTKRGKIDFNKKQWSHPRNFK